MRTESRRFWSRLPRRGRPRDRRVRGCARWWSACPRPRRGAVLPRWPRRRASCRPGNRPRPADGSDRARPNGALVPDARTPRTRRRAGAARRRCRGCTPGPFPADLRSESWKPVSKPIINRAFHPTAHTSRRGGPGLTYVFLLHYTDPVAATEISVLQGVPCDCCQVHR